MRWLTERDNEAEMVAVTRLCDTGTLRSYLPNFVEMDLATRTPYRVGVVGDPPAYDEVTERKFGGYTMAFRFHRWRDTAALVIPYVSPRARSKALLDALDEVRAQENRLIIWARLGDLNEPRHAPVADFRLDHEEKVGLVIKASVTMNGGYHAAEIGEWTMFAERIQSDYLHAYGVMP